MTTPPIDTLLRASAQKSEPPPPDQRIYQYSYCEQCGAKLDISQEQYGYDPFSGEPRMLTSRRCPNRRRPSHWFR